MHDLSIYHNNKNNCYYSEKKSISRSCSCKNRDKKIQKNNNKEACRNKNETDGSLTVLVV